MSRISIDLAAVKRQADGRWREILSALGGISIELLDGKNHPCPKCGGTDRFRMIDVEAGALFCNQCHNKNNGDGIAALMWLRGWDFLTAAREVAQFVAFPLDAANANGSHKANGRPTAPATNNSNGSDLESKLLFVQAPPEGIANAVSLWCSKKPPITTAAALAYGTRVAAWPPKAPPPYRQMVVVFRGRHVGRDDHAAAVLLYRQDGAMFPALGDLPLRKVHLLGDSRESWLWPGTSDDLKAAQALLVCEGLPDALAATSAGLLEGMIAVTNACGAKSTNLDYSIGAGKLVLVNGDADKPGKEGATAKADGFRRAGAKEVRLVTLPYEVTEDRGKDLRDFLAEGGDLFDLLDKSQKITEADLPPSVGKKNDATATRKETTRSVRSVEPGARLRCKDRDNFGMVVSDNGRTCVMHFVSPDGTEATKELDKSELVDADGKPLVESTEPPRFIASLLTSPQFDDLDAEPMFLVRNAVPSGQMGAAGGKSKGGKTSVSGVDLSMSVASGTPFLGEFEVPEPAPVLFLCGESGASKIRRQARHICEARGLNLRSLPIFWGFDLPKLCQPAHVEALAELIERKGIRLAIVDPLYLSLFTAESAGRSGDLYTMGATFEPLTAVCRSTGASILLIHHFRKNRYDDDQEPCSLDELSQAGLAEVARWWILLDRREPYAGDGRHAFWLRIGGSEGHASFWSLDIDEGLSIDSEGNQRITKWETRLGRVQDAKAEKKRQQEQRKAEILERREDEHVDKLRNAMRKYPQGETAKQLRADAKMNNDTFLRTVGVLTQRGEVEQFVFTERRGKPDGYKLKT